MWYEAGKESGLRWCVTEVVSLCVIKCDLGQCQESHFNDMPE